MVETHKERFSAFNHQRRRLVALKGSQGILRSILGDGETARLVPAPLTTAASVDSAI